MAVSETVFSTIDDFPKTGSGFGVVRNPLTLYEGFTIPEYSRCIFINYTNSNDGALIAIISDKTYTAFRNNGNWQSGRILVTNTDLTARFNPIRINGELNDTFKSILKDKCNNSVNFIAFTNNPSDNPFSFNAGYVIAFHSGMINSNNILILIGSSSIDSSQIEVKRMDLRL